METERNIIETEVRLWPIIFSLAFFSHLLILCGTGLLQAIGVLGLLLAPGAIWCSSVLKQTNPLERAFVSIAFGFASALFASYGLAFIPLGLTSYSLVILADTCLIILAVSKKDKIQISYCKLPRLQSIFLCLILILGAYFRTYNLGQSDFQGDESRAMILAVATLQNQPEVLFTHKKGPAEVLFPAIMMASTGLASEGAARLPFALAGIVLPLGVFAIIRRWYSNLGPTPALLAAAFVAFDGFLLAFSRIVQYQSLLVLFSLAAIACASSEALNAKRFKLSAYMVAIFLAAGLFSHFDTIFLVPLTIYLLNSRWQSLRLFLKSSVATLCKPAILFFLLTASFFLPFLTHDKIGSTAVYLGQRLGARKLPVNNLDRYWHLLSFYQTAVQTYFTVIVACLALLYLLKNLELNRFIKTALAVLFVAGVYSSVFDPRLLDVYELRSLALLCFGFPLLTAILLSRDQNTKSILLWVIPGFLGLGFLFARPNTHFYVFHMGLSIAIALAISSLKRPFLRRGATGLAVAVLCFSIPYLHIAYVRLQPELRHSFPNSRPEIYTAPFGRRLPSGAYFGFPHRSGWQAIGALYANGTLRGSYNSNEEELITSWYTRGAERKTEDPDYYFLVSNPNDPVPLSRPKVERTYNFWGRIYVESQKRLDIFSLNPPISKPTPFQLEDLRTDFANLTINSLPIPPLIASLSQSR